MNKNKQQTEHQPLPGAPVSRSAILKLNHFVFQWYYKRVPKFFHKWTLLKSISLLIQNYNHAEKTIESLEEVTRNASKREREMQSQISNLELKVMGVTQDKIDAVNRIFGTDLQGRSTFERDN